MAPSTLLSRRRLLGVAGAATVGSALLDPAWFRSSLNLDATVGADAWPMARRDPGRTGFAERGPTQGVELAWQHRLPDSTPGVVTAVAVAEGTVYTATRYAVHALGADAGTPQWAYDLSAAGWFGVDWFGGELQFVQSWPVVGDGGVYISAGSALFAVGPQGGSRWEYDTTSSFENLLVVGNTVYLTSTLDEETLVALDTVSGLPR